MGLNALRNNMLAEVRERVVQQLADDLPIEDVNAHRGQEKLPIAFDAQFRMPFIRQPQRVWVRGLRPCAFR